MKILFVGSTFRGGVVDTVRLNKSQQIRHLLDAQFLLHIRARKHILAHTNTPSGERARLLFTLLSEQL